MEENILLFINQDAILINKGYDLPGLILLYDQLSDYRQFSQEFKDSLLQALIDEIDEG
jgi:hypothetical protein